MIFLSRLFLGLFILRVVESGMCKKSGYGTFIWANHNNVDGYWKHFDWDVITTIGFFGSLDEGQLIGMREYAHERGVKLVKGVGMEDDQVVNATYRSQWIDQQIKDAISEGYDGVNIDHEGQDPRTYEGWTALMVDTANAFHEKLPGSEVSADVGIYPEYEFRNMTMNYTAMGEAMDYLFIMGYDGEFWDNVQCINPNSQPECSNACAPMQSLVYGVESYIKLGVDPKKLYLGLPWYGIKYEFVKKIPFQTGQIDISEIQAIQRKHPNMNITIDTKSMTKILDCGGLCEYDSIKNKEWYSQIWYDDEETLAPKYKLAKDYGLKGVGMWQASGLVYTDGLPADIMQGKKIWGSMCQ